MTDWLRLAEYRRWVYGLLLTMAALMLAVGAAPASAHANLSTAAPAPNSAVAASPAEIRLTFTEPLEAAFSQITLRDASGQRLNTPAAEVDAANPTQLVLRPGTLADGLYTVVWRVVSAADGHMTAGSYAFAVGAVSFEAAALVGLDESISNEDVLARWINFLGMGLLVGAAAFWLFVWLPAGVQTAGIERQLEDFLWFGWVLAGAAAIASLLLQVAIAADTSLLGAVSSPALADVLRRTRFGELWQVRLALWGAAGIGLLLLENRIKAGRTGRAPLWGVLLSSIGVLLTTSQYSHASAAQDATAAIAGDWLHLTMMSLWLGGLAAFVVVIAPVRKTAQDAPQAVGRLVGAFSNLMRVAVAGLILTGIYSAWLLVGSVEALVTTVYGRAMLIKLLLTLPLLVLAGVNLIFTQRGLRRGELPWVGRLRGLIGAEIALLSAVLFAVSMMTSGTPARSVMAVRDAQAPPAPDTTYFEMQQTDDLMAHLEITPGTVGENTFTISLYTLDNTPIMDASLIRLRFENPAQNLGESELRPVSAGDGTYVIEGSNLSVPGEWQLRLTVRRPGAFDAVLDYVPDVPPATPPPAPVVETTLPPFDRLAAALLVGMGLVGLGGFFAAIHGLRWSGGGDWLAAGMIAVGAVFLVTAVGSVDALDARARAVVARDAWMPPAAAAETGSVYLTLDNATATAARLVQAETSAALNTEITLTQMRDGETLVRPVDDLDLPAGSSVALAAGGYHLRLEHLTRDYVAGDTFDLTLVFASGQRTTIPVRVEER